MRVADFVITGPLGRGGMGEVWRARHGASGLPAAIKVITAAVAHDAEFQQRFHREVQAVASLDHPAVVRIFDYGFIQPDEAEATAGEMAADSPYVALELADAGTLSDAMAAGLRWADVRAVLLAVLDALAHSHARGLVHRDIKPDNVLAFGAGRERRWKLTDFGIAQWLDVERAADTQPMSGTPSYMAPEQFGGQWRQLGPPTDLYAVGCLAYQLVCGRLPHDAPNPIAMGLAHMHEEPAPFVAGLAVPDGFGDWVAWLMRKDPQARPQTAADAAWGLVRLGEPGGPATSQAAVVDPQVDTIVSAPGAIVAPTLGLDGLDLADLLDADRAGRRAGPPAMAGERPPPPVPGDWRRSGGAPDEADAEPISAAASWRLFGLRRVPMVDRLEERDWLWQWLTTAIAAARGW